MMITIWNWIVYLSKWILGIIAAYLIVFSLLVQLLPPNTREIDGISLQVKNIGSDSSKRNISFFKDTSKIPFMKIEGHIKDLEIVVELLQYEFPPSSSISVDKKGRIFLGFSPQYFIVFLLLILYLNARKKAQTEREMRLVLLQELENRFRARGSNLHDVVINPMKQFAEQLPQTLMKHVSASLPDEDYAMHIALELHEPLKNLAQHMNQIASKAHDIYCDIAPPIHLMGLPNTIQTYVEEIRKQNPNLIIDTTLAEIKNLDTTIGIQLYRIMQEAIGNAILHGKAKHIQVHLGTENKMLYLKIKDDGIGFIVPKNLEDWVRLKHTGLANMNYRAESIRAKLVILSAPHQGTTIDVQLRPNLQNSLST